MIIGIEQTTHFKILASTLAADVLPEQCSKSLITTVKSCPESFSVLLAATEALSKPSLKRLLKIIRPNDKKGIDVKFDLQGKNFFYLEHQVGQSKLFFKSALPGELQARLAVESTIDRFLEFLRKKYWIVVLDESDRHVQLFFPNTSELENLSIESLWDDFVTQVLFSSHGLPRLQLPGLMQSFVAMLKSVTLAGRGFSVLEIPIITREQANVLAAWYFAVWREAQKRQDDRHRKIKGLQLSLEGDSLSDKERKSTAKLLQDAEAMQAKEDKKYLENFQKFFGGLIENHKTAYSELITTQASIDAEPSKAELKKLVRNKEKIEREIIFSQDFIERQSALYEQSQGNPFLFVDQDCQNGLSKFKKIKEIAKSFNKTATDQIAGVKGDIFSKCIIEMYRLMEMTDEQIGEGIAPLLTDQPIFQLRNPGDDSKEFCYSCGTALESKTAEWQVRRLVFESPEQRRQSATGKGRPHICKSCAVLAFASPLKLTGESIILKLEPASGIEDKKLKIKDYLRMLASKELHLSAGKYIILASDKTQGGDSASQKLGQVQYALAKVASTFPTEVLTDFRFSLMTQGNEDISLSNRHLIFIKGLIDFYSQNIIIPGKDINLTLGDAVRYVQQDLPYLAEYTVTKASSFSNKLEMEKIRTFYWNALQTYLTLRGDSMDSDNQIAKRARLFRDVAALTGLTLAFATSLESTAKNLGMGKDDREREVSKLIEKVEDPVAFCYYATLGDEKKTSVEARLWLNSDNSFIYAQTKSLLSDLALLDREATDEDGKTWLKLYSDDILRAYTHFSEKKDYCQDKDWKDLTYQVRLSLYTRFPELVRKPKKGDK